MYTFLKKCRRVALNNLINVCGWKTDQKIILFESDDWGGIGVPSRRIRDRLCAAGLNLCDDPFTAYDSLASADDLASLFETLTAYRGSNGRHPMITANCVMANPDFDKIRESAFTTFFYEPFQTTMEQHPDCEKSLDGWREGMKQNLFFPQFHCREHVNAGRWLERLQRGEKTTMTAFDNRIVNLAGAGNVQKPYLDMQAFNHQTSAQLDFMRESIADGLRMFEHCFGYRSRSFIAPSYVWSAAAENVFAQNKVEFIQGVRAQRLPSFNLIGGLKKKRHWLGQKNKHTQRYLLRNCHFEPSTNKNKDWVDECLNRIEIAFRWKKPATISTHRLNYVGRIEPANRDASLKALSTLLRQILKKWPEVQFMNTVELGDRIRSNS